MITSVHHSRRAQFDPAQSTYSSLFTFEVSWFKVGRCNSQGDRRSSLYVINYFEGILHTRSFSLFRSLIRL